MRIPRRVFLTRAAATAGSLAFVGPLDALRGRLAEPPGLLPSPPWGELVPTLDATTGLPLLALPPGFRYRTFGWTGDPLDDGSPTPHRHDGQACFAAPGGRLVLVRNHEIDRGVPFAPRALTYDPVMGGGTTTLELDRRTGAVVAARASLSGTSRNCAGGATPWGSWLSCEEASGDGRASHGWVFEVPAFGTARPEPLYGMGRFVHEAVAVDPSSGHVYETEDADPAGLYRFLPEVPGELARGGRLQMLAIEGAPGYDTRRGQTVGVPLPVRWVDIDDPDASRESVFAQGFAAGGAIFARLEGAAHDRGTIFAVSTNGGDLGAGQVWALDGDGSRLRLVFESTDPERANGIDNVCAAPGGSLVLCQDGYGPQHVFVLLPDGRLVPFARNEVVLNGERNGIVGDFRWSELTGCAFSPGGRWLFFNVQEPGIGVAIDLSHRTVKL